MDVDELNKDLPLMANVNEILVTHYIFNLFCSFKEKKFSGYVILELKSVTDNCPLCCNDTNFNIRDEFNFVLDSTDIIIYNVEEVNRKNLIQDCKFQNLQHFETISKLNFTVEKWSLRISKPKITCSCNFPKLVKISYETKPSGLSVLWVKDQENRPAVYTYGAWINNRSLFPCQEPPIAMATWEAYISVIHPAIVLMSGDSLPTIRNNENIVTYYYYTKMILPLSTLALAVGFWETHLLKCNYMSVGIRICATSCLMSKAIEEFSDYIFSAVQAAESLLGSYPFPRIDFLIVPRGFCSLGMASPNIVFLSQTLLSGNMCCRIAHEISHGWFGLLIGALDWTEEWLSEGFATFMEDIIHVKALNMNFNEEKQYIEIKSYARFNTLLAEIQNTDEDLQILRPNKGDTKKEIIEGVNAIVLKNGQNTEKAFMQVHYIKGYFLLKYLKDLVGAIEFLKFLRSYILRYKGQLVESTEMLTYFVEMFQDVCDKNVTVEKIVSDWLRTPGVPKPMQTVPFSFSFHLFGSALREAKKWSVLNAKCLKKDSKKRRYDISNFQKLTSEELLLVLDDLLKERKIAFYILKQLSQHYGLEKQNAEIRHKWCELVVKHRYRPAYTCIKDFLMNDLAMGIYLYGELILNGTALQRELAKEIFHEVKDEMEPNCIVTIEDMFTTSQSEI